MPAIFESHIARLYQMSLMLMLTFSSSMSVVQANPELLKNLTTVPKAQSAFPDDMTDLNGVLIYTASRIVDGQYNGYRDTGRRLRAFDGVNVSTLTDDDLTPSNFVVVGAFAFFTGNDGETGRELWRTDGTKSGTMRLTDINPGSGNSSPSNLTIMGDQLYFTATDGATTSLCKSDGTEVGTYCFTSIQQWRFKLSVVGNELYYTGTTTNNTLELWKTDGTPSGTVLLKEIHQASLVALTSDVLFYAIDNGTTYELWQTKTATLETDFLWGFAPDTGNQFGFSALVGNTLYLRVMVSNEPGYLLKSAGSSSETEIIVNTNVYDLQAIDNKVYFVIYDEGVDLLVTDGTEAGTKILWDNLDDNGSSEWRAFDGLRVVGNTVYVLLDDQASQALQLWRIDGTPGGTVLLGNVDSASGYGYYPEPNLQAIGDTLYYSISYTTNNQYKHELWASDSSSHWKVSTNSNAEFVNQPNNFSVINDNLYFNGNDGLRGAEIWKSDGTAAGTKLVVNTQSDDASTIVSHAVTFDNRAYFFVPEFTPRIGISTGKIWVSDGFDTWPLVDIQFEYDEPQFTILEDTLYFTNYDDTTGTELWKSDGTSTGTVRVADINPDLASSWPRNVKVVNNNLYFFADDGVHGYELWKTDGTSAGTTLVKDIMPGFNYLPYFSFEVFDNTLYFSVGGQLWKTDGTEAGTVQISDSQNTWLKLIAAGGKLFYFGQTDSTHQVILWESDGTPNGTQPVKEIGFLKSEITVVNDSFYFYSSPNQGYDAAYFLWKSDGTEAGTGRVQGREYFKNPQDITVIGDTLYFSATNSPSGRELWKSDGTWAGTKKIIDIIPGPVGSNPSDFVVVSNKLYFSANDSVFGRELWVTDGTQGGTHIVHDLVPGNASSYAKPILTLGTDLFFMANDGVHGNEPWKYKTQPVQVGTAKLGDFIWSDGNGDGIQNNNEAGLPNVTIELMTCNNSSIDTTTSDSNGSYLFEQIVPGDYRVRVRTPSGYTLSPAGQGSNYQLDSNVDAVTGIGPCLSMADGQQRLAIDIGMVPVGTGGGTGSAVLGDYVWSDLNGDGVQDSNEPGLSGVTIELLSCSNALLQTVESDANGHFRFDQLAAGDYRMRALPLNGYAFSPAGQGRNYQTDSNVNASTGIGPCLSMADGQQRLAVDIGMVPTGTGGGNGTAILGDYVWSDLNGDGVQDSYEPGLSGVTIELLSCSNALLQTVESDANGHFRFDQLAAGDYRMRALPLDGYAFSPAGQGGNYQTDSNVNATTGIGPCLSMADGQQRLAIDIGMVPVGTGGGNGTAILGDYVWSDLNGDGVQDSYEPGLSGVTVELLSCSNSLLQTVQSDVNGYFRFDQLVAGDYRLRAILLNGYAFSPAGQGGNYQTDSNVNATTGIGPCLSMADGQQRLAIDIGMIP